MRITTAVAFRLPVALSLLLAVTVSPAVAQTWTGNTSGAWNTASNWSPMSVPTSGTGSLTFGATPNLVMTNDIPGTFTVNTLRFLVGGLPYFLSGNSLSLTNIEMATNNTIEINNPTTTNTIRITGPGIGDLNLNGLMSGSGGLNHNYSGTVRLSNPSNNFTGPVTVGSDNPPPGLNATLVIPSIANGGVSSPLGASSSTTSNLKINSRGTLLLTGTNAAYSTDRGLTLTDTFNKGGGINVQNAGTTLTWNGPIIGSALTKYGAGTLVLASSGNTYSSGTTVQQGLLLLGNANAVRSTTIVRPGATFDTGGFSNSTAVPVIYLDGGTFRHSSSSPYTVGGLRSFITAGAKFDLTGSAGSGLKVGGDMLFEVSASIIGAGSTYLDNTSTGTIQVFIDSGVTVTSGVSLAAFNSPSTHPFRILDGGTLHLTSAPAYQALVTVTQASRLRMDSIAGVGVGPGALELTLDNGTFQYSGASNSAGALALGTGGGTVDVTSAGTTMFLTGPITGASTAVLTKTGAGTLALPAAASTFSSLTIAAGTLQTASDAALGTGAVTFGPFATLRYTASTSTSRAFNMALGTMAIDNGATLTLNGSSINSGTIRGSGTLAIGGGVTLSAVTTATSLNVQQTGAVTAMSLTNGGAFTVGAGQTLAWNVGTNTSSGRLTVNGTANVTDVVSDGQINIPAGGVLANSGAALVFGGGRRTFVGSPAAPGGILDLGGHALELNGSLLVNNGTVNGTVNVNYGSLAKGAGQYGVVNVGDGGNFAPGNSPGIVTVGSITFDNAATTSGGPALSIELAGSAPATEYDQLHVTGQLSLGGTLDVSLINGFAPAAGQSFDILDWGTRSGTFAALDLPTLAGGLQWNTSQLYTTGVISVGLPGDFNSNGSLDTADYVVWRKNPSAAYTPTDYNTWRAHFGQPAGSGAGVSSNAAVPEPATLMLLLFSAAGWCLRRVRSAVKV